MLPAAAAAPTPEFIKLLNGTFAGCTPGRPAHRMPSVLCTPVDTVTVDGITVVGERINPTGKKALPAGIARGRHETMCWNRPSVRQRPGRRFWT